MPDFTRRALNRLIAAGAAGLAGAPFGPSLARAQQPAQPTPPRFSFEEVQRRARDLAAAAFAPAPALSEALQKLDFQAWREIRFRGERSFFAGNGGSPFRLQTFHLGHLYRRAVTINIIREGIASPIPYAAGLFDYGRTKFDKPLPINLGFAGFRLHYPLNDPRGMDEIIAFLGANGFRMLGRGQRYGMSAMGLGVNPGSENEEAPNFHEFWIETPEAGAEKTIFYALLDSESVTAAYRFELSPGIDTILDVRMTVYPRRPVARLAIAPLSSLFLSGENDRRFTQDFRPEVHDSDGLLINTGHGEWLWRPLRNPDQQSLSSFLDRDTRGFGLLQRDRNFENYQDLEHNFEMRPSYWIEPREGWGEGRIELIEKPAADHRSNNIFVGWSPSQPAEPGKPLSFSYRLTSCLDIRRLSPSARAIATYQNPPRALGSNEPIAPGSRRFIIDFAGGELRYFQSQPEAVEIVPSTSAGTITRSSVLHNPQTGGFRASFDIQVPPGQTTDLRAYLKAGNRALSETWTYPWRAE
ncbi:MAG: putative glucans biosynthesis protein [Pseudomonadota bacterium]